MPIPSFAKNFIFTTELGITIEVDTPAILPQKAL